MRVRVLFGIMNKINKLILLQKETDVSYTDVILEEVRDQYKVISEGLGILLPLPERVNVLEAKLDEIDRKLQVIEPVIKAHSQTMKTHGTDLAEIKTMVSSHSHEIIAR